MLMRTDPFRDLDRLTQQLLGTNARPSAMLMDAWRDGDRFVVEFDLPGVSPDSVDLDVERNVLTVTAQRPPLDEKAEFLAAERPRGVFSRQLVLGDNLDLDRIEAALPGRGAAAAHPGRGEGQAPEDHHQPRRAAATRPSPPATTETASSATTTPSTPPPLPDASRNAPPARWSARGPSASAARSSSCRARRCSVESPAVGRVRVAVVIG